MRRANENDMPRIVEIYNSTINSRMTTADTEKVTVESRSGWFGKHSEKRPIFVEEIDGILLHGLASKASMEEPHII